MVGLVGFYDIDIGKQVWLSIAIFHPADRRQGYGSQALALVLRSLQKSAGVKTACVEIDEANIPSLRMCAKLGFVVQRRSHGHVFLSLQL
jgi:RimJ/RimL family protein N-acetyltransferase